MKPATVYVGQNTLHTTAKAIQGKIVEIGNESYYKISNYDRMESFFMSIVSDSDHWMFLSSTGGITAGRINADNTLFPYGTDDRIHDAANNTGSKTILLIERDGKIFKWEPFSTTEIGVYAIERNLYKNVLGNKIIFEEINNDLGVTFQYEWLNSEKYGFIKRSRIVNQQNDDVVIRFVDGIRNILPYGITQRFQMEYSTLGDAYKKSELDQKTGLAIYTLSSIPTDKAEPSESLKATVVWSTGLREKSILLSSSQLNQVRTGRVPDQETDVRALRGAYFVYSQIQLSRDEAKEWYIVSEINQDSAAVAELSQLLTEAPDLQQDILDDVASGSRNLMKIVANSDGLQMSADPLRTARHFSNVLFNVMRGGIFDNDYMIDTKDFYAFLQTTNRSIQTKHDRFLSTLPSAIHYPDLLEKIANASDPGLMKLGYEYLPITFGRRHGDPSRPWNQFSIEIKDPDGHKILNYQGNWRDIFQNWEALALSFPDYIESMICKFVNASSADGYNPYRVTRDGFDWEVLDPNDPWSYIGYWGDHQIIYLLKLLELSQRHHPGKLEAFLTKSIFAYANIPYHIKSYHELLDNPHDTINFDTTLDQQIRERVASLGSDGNFVRDSAGEINFVNLTEKLLVPVLAKLANFIPEGGIWMNTQRPEWNDANNALVGYGISMVTLCYMRRHLNFCRELFQSIHGESVTLSTEVSEFFRTVAGILEKYLYLTNKSMSGTDRRKVLDELGQSGSDYRKNIYSQGFSKDTQQLSRDALLSFCEHALQHIDSTIRANKRDDSLYHAYNLMNLEKDSSLSIHHLSEMLEGQVAVLSSGLLSISESLDVLEALRNSKLYREDQFSYILYPDRQLTRFMDKNRIPTDLFQKSDLLQKLIQKENRQIVIQDKMGGCHFNGSIRNACVLKESLHSLSDPDLMSLVDKDEQLVLGIYESMFNHKQFTGRSGTFYKYEGLGSIYWHMVSKLLVAVQEIYHHAIDEHAEPAIIKELTRHYYDILNGIGLKKTPEQYGAFPTDPYSHTPGHTGVQQPGMTGQVKEDILIRFGELGIFVDNGKISFRPLLLEQDEFLLDTSEFTFSDVNGQQMTIKLNKGSMAFTYCQVPVIYSKSDERKMILTLANSTKTEINGLTLDETTSASLFHRDGTIRRIDVFVIQN